MSCKLVLSVLCCFGLAAICAAQDPRGSLVGTVSDSSGAVVPGVEVRATRIDTGVTARSVTNEAGKYDIPFLLPGTYHLTAAKDGFKTSSVDKIDLRVDDTLDIPIRLDVGNVSETIDVHEDRPLLDTASSTVGQVMDERRMLELPQKGGNPLELARLVPGMVNLTNIRTMKSSSPSGTSQSSVNGTGTNSTLYNIDGVSDTTNDGGGAAPRVAFIPPSSAIVEFKMESNPYDASAGHVFGPVINISTKGGTNELHGSLYDWEKNSAFDAMNFFDNKAGLAKFAYQDHRSGTSLGGPVDIPRLYDGRNKTFFFYAWEEDLWTSPANTNQFATVPTAAERTGDFSALLAVGSQYQVYNPFSTRAASSGRYQRDPFPGNIIPKSMLSAVGLNLANMWPTPNEPGTVDGTNNYFYPDLRSQSYQSHMGRVDHAFSANNRLFLRLNHYTFTVPKNSLGVPATKEINTQNNRGAALDDVIVLGPSLVLNLRYGVVSADYPQTRATEGTDLSALGFSPSFISLVDARRATVPGIKLGSFASLSTLNDGATSALTHSWLADLTKLKGSHTIRLGVDLRLMRTFGNQYGVSLSPNLTFSSSYTRGPLDNSTAAPLGDELAEMLLGIPEGSMTSPTSWATEDKYYGVYFQDDFRVTSRLTLNLGLRYEMDWPVTERYNRLVAAYDYADPSPLQAQAKLNYAKNPIPELPASAFSAMGGLSYVGQNGSGRSPYKGNYGEIMPRIGLAYQLAPKTVFRAGYGIYFDTLGVDRFIPIQTGFSQSTPIQPTQDNGVSYIATLSNPFPNGLLAPLGASGGLSTNLGQAISVFDPHLKPPYSQRWSAGLQHFLPGQFLVDVSYVGNRSTHLGVTRNINATPAQYLSTSPFRDTTTINYVTATFPSPFYGLNSVYSSTMSRANLLRPYPQFGDISVSQPVGYSWYHSMQVRVEKRLSHGYTVEVGYTYSRYMQATSFLNATDPTPYRVISDSDRPQVLTMSGLWEIPFGKGRRFGSKLPAALDFIAGGWQFDAGVVRQGGAPLGFGNALFIGNLDNIPLPKSQRSVNEWFNVNAGFDRNSKDALANNLQTLPIRFSGVRADGQATWNSSLIKNFRIRERFNTQFRAEVYNALNHPSFDVPNTTPTSSAFGTITNTLSEPRGFQFALKVTF